LAKCPSTTGFDKLNPPLRAKSNKIKGVKMTTAKPKSMMIIAGLLILLALLSITSAISTQTGFARVRQPGQLNGATRNGGNSQGGNGGNFQGGNGGNFQGGNGNNGTFQNRTGNNNVLGSVFRLLGPSFIYISLGITILGIILALLSAFGVWKLKKWGLNLGMVVALLFLLGALPGLFTLGGRNINILRTSITILSLIASAPILVMGILPSVRDSFAK
jgi:hypothetical protein